MHAHPILPRLGALLVGFLLVSAAALAQRPTDTYTLDFTFRQPQYAGCSGDLWESMLGCDMIETRAMDLGDSPNFAWIVLAGVPDEAGVGGLQFGIEYPAEALVEARSWALCTGGSEIPQDDEQGTWPESGTGNAMTFAGGCHRVTENDDGATKVGFFFATSGGEGLLRFANDPRIDEILVADCEANLLTFCEVQLGTGETDVDGEPGDLACGQICDATPVREATWSAVKSFFRD